MIAFRMHAMIFTPYQVIEDTTPWPKRGDGVEEKTDREARRREQGPITTITHLKPITIEMAP